MQHTREIHPMTDDQDDDTNEDPDRPAHHDARPLQASLPYNFG
jgi:hypothetical protein